MSSSHLRSVRTSANPEQEQLERVQGSTDTQTIKWYRTGLDRAASVAAIRKRLSNHIGSGFAVRGEDFGLAPGEILLLNNFHIVNKEGAGIGSRPEVAEIVCEAEDPQFVAPGIGEVIAQLPSRGGLDFALL